MTSETARKMTGIIIIMTGIIIIALALALVIHYIVVDMKFGAQATISQVICDTSSAYTWVGMIAGFLIGQWFWKSYRDW